MSARYFALLTNIGVAKIANAAALGIKLNITELAVGDGGGTLPTPTPDQTALVNERRRAPINQLSIDPINDAQIIVEQVIPENVGGWWIKEVGLYDEDGDLIAVSNCPETYKPLLQEGSGRTQIVRMVIIVSNTSSVAVKIDPAVVLATRAYVDSKFDKLSRPMGASGIGFQSPGEDAIQRTVLEKILEGAISVLDYKYPDEGNYIDHSLRRIIKFIKTGKSKSRSILIPPAVGEWLCSREVLFDISDIFIFLYGDTRLDSKYRQKTFLFASSNAMDPSVKLKNITLISNGAKINGNAAEMEFNYSHGDGSDNDSTVRFNYVDNVKAFNLHVDNGPIDSLSLRRCRNWLVDGCTFTRAKEDNGFSATTDWSNWSVGRPETWGFGTIRNCVAYDNQDFGMTAFNVSGVTFDKCLSYNNRSGYSYEDSKNSPGIKRFFGLFTSCSTYNCRDQGFYIQCDGVRVDDTCSSYNIRGYKGEIRQYNTENSDGIFENGVVVSNVATCYIGGNHEHCGHSGVAIFNDGVVPRPTAVTVNGSYNWNDASGIYARGVGELIIVNGTTLHGNGRKLFNGRYSLAIDISNSGGPGYFQGDGFLKADGVTIKDSGLGAIHTNFLGTSIISNCNMVNNAQLDTSPAMVIERGKTARISNNHAPSNTGKQTFVVSIDAETEDGFEYLNTGDGTTGIVANNAWNTQQTSRGARYLSTAYEGKTVPANSQVAINLALRGAAVGDFVQVSMTSNIGMLMPIGTISSDGNVTVYMRNFTQNPITYAAGQIRVIVTKRSAG